MELGSGKFLADPFKPLVSGIARFKPPEKVRTVDWATENRKFKLPDSGAIVDYDPMRTPYNLAFSDALDDPSVELAVMVKPSRSGGTATVENYLGKLIDIGPFPRTAWILGSDKAVKEYVEGVVKDLFELHSRLRKKIGSGRSDNTDKMKRISGQLLEFLAANDNTFRNREFGLGVMDEPDGWTKFSETPKVQLQGRQKNLGRRSKGVILSHPDKGYKAGVTPAYAESSRGILILRCPDCGGFAASYATKFWKNVPEFKLRYEKKVEGRSRQKLSADERIELAERTAGLACPHCGVVHDDAARDAMVDEAGLSGWWMHRGQWLDPDKGIQGEPDPHNERGFWVHGTVVKTSPLKKLAKGLEEALIRYERSGGSRAMTKVLREYHSKQLGEIFEGKSTITGLSSDRLQKRAKDAKQAKKAQFPAEAHFVVASVDVQKTRFDVSFYAFDVAARSWWLDRIAIRQRPDENGRLRDIHTRERVDDWQVLIDEVLTRQFPVQGRSELKMPVAVMTVDIKDGNVTAVGREFARRSIIAGHTWNGWPKVRPIMGANSDKAAEVPPPRILDRDDNGKPIVPAVHETTLGVFKLKELILDRLAIEHGGPGQCYFNPGISSDYFDELFAEPLIEGKFDRRGDNESFDLAVYAEAGRVMLNPSHRDNIWDDMQRRPIWAQPIVSEAEDRSESDQPISGSKKKSIFEQFDALNQEDQE